MKKIQVTTHLETLQADTRQLMLRLSYLHQLPASKLTTPPAPGRWSVAQAIEHLNTYGRYYLPAIEKAIRNSNEKPTDWFKPGWLGSYFTRSMAPKADGTISNKMKTFKNHDPAPTTDAAKALHNFEEQELWLIELMDKARAVNINTIRIPISIAPFIKLKLGDVFNFLIAHHQRHFLQIDNTLKALNAQ